MPFAATRQDLEIIILSEVCQSVSVLLICSFVSFFQILHMWCVLAVQSCLTLWDPKDCSPPGSSILGIFQARILEWVAILFSRGSSWPRNRTQISCITGTFFTIWRLGKPTVHGIFQARILEWAASSFSRHMCYHMIFVFLCPRICIYL